MLTIFHANGVIFILLTQLFVQRVNILPSPIVSGYNNIDKVDIHQVYTEIILKRLN
jgi:hypothetical protein